MVILPASSPAPWVWLIEQRELSCEKLVRSCHSSAYSPPVTSHLLLSKNQNTVIWSSPSSLNSPSTLPFVHSTAIIAFLHNCQLTDIVLSLCLECSLPRCHVAYSPTSFRSAFRCHLLTEASFDHSVRNYYLYNSFYLLFPLYFSPGHFTTV